MQAVAEVMSSLINTDNKEDKEMFDQMTDLPNIPDFVNLKERKVILLDLLCHNILIVEVMSSQSAL